jgi:hypothetical protein
VEGLPDVRTVNDVVPFTAKASSRITWYCPARIAAAVINATTAMRNTAGIPLSSSQDCPGRAARTFQHQYIAEPGAASPQFFSAILENGESMATGRKIALILGAAAAVLTASSAGRIPFRVYPSLEPYDEVALPPDHAEKTEWVFGRLMFPNHPRARFGWMRGRHRDWRDGYTAWTQDYPRADRTMSLALRRLTRIHVRSVEQPVNPDDGDDIFDYPFLFAGELGDWQLTQPQAARLREFLLRGGFLMLDDFWGTEEWDRFMESMELVLPNRAVTEIEDHDPSFHTVYDLNERFQVPGDWAIRRGTTYRNDGSVGRWRAMRDDRERIMVAMAFNHDLGDGWEWADSPHYPEKYSALAIRVGVNWTIYALTH